MLITPFPENEQERLTELARLSLLDSEPEERFDCITRLTAHLFDVPISLVSLVDKDRQWFKSKYGLDSCETDRSISFCGHTILQSNIFYIPDTLEDERFADNPLVTGEPGVRMYAGSPLTTASGFPIGALCIVDTKPRELTDSQLEMLRDLSKLVQLQLEAFTQSDRTQLLEDHQSYLGALVDNTSDGIITVNKFGAVESTNRAAESLFGCTQEGVVKQSISSFIPLLQGFPFDNRDANNKRSFLRDVEIVKADGSQLPVDLSIIEVTVQGQPKCICTIKDISDRKEAEEERARFRAIIETSDDAIISKTLDSIITSWNFGAEKMFGYKAEEVIGKSILILFPPMLADEEKSIIEQISSGNRVEHFETVRQRKDGSLFPISVTCSPIFDDSGKVVAISKIARDITERKLTEHSLLLRKTALEREVKEQGHDLRIFGHIISTTRELMIFVDRNYVFQAANQSYLKTIGRTQEQVIGHHIQEVHGKRFFNKKMKPLLDSCLKGERLQTESWDSLHGLEPRCFEMLFDPHKDENNRVVGVVISSRDVTEAKNTERFLISANQKAEAANEAKSQFLSNMSHELRTPLTAIVSYSELLIEKTSPNNDTSQLELLNKVHNAGEQLLKTITDIVNFTKALDTEQTCESRIVAIDSLFQEIAKAIEPKMKTNNNHLLVECQEDIGEIETDPNKLTDLLMHLLDNAAKFTKSGRVSLSAKRVVESDFDQLEFAVSDTGTGIETGQIPTLFEPFEQADNSNTREHGGLGLGLSLVKKHSEILGGDILVDSEAGSGSVFRLILPADVSQKSRVSTDERIA